MDPSTPRRPSRLATAVAAIALAGAAACTGCARDRYYSATPGDSSGGIGRIVRRPALEKPEVKPLFVGGYAGADYNRMSRPVPLRNRPMDIE
ncbi:hypothetical protein [Paludisphaera soli]|uniref:hypothetical protein n=1 Tax=Paludisphaera soli TaxID=2712865 RepID=UPI0013EB57BE|nr:hypothetical protein [Paludisphaera soli]